MENHKTLKEQIAEHINYNAVVSGKKALEVAEALETLINEREKRLREILDNVRTQAGRHLYDNWTYVREYIDEELKNLPL